MKCIIRHESRGRLRVHLCCTRMTLREADLLEYSLRAVEGVTEVKVYGRTQDAVVLYRGEREAGCGRWGHSPLYRRRRWTWCRSTPRGR